MHLRHADQIIRYTLTLLVVVGADRVSAQSVAIYAQGGIASYTYSELRDFQNQLMGNVPSKASATSQFPTYYTYGLGLRFEWTRWTLGVEYGHGSTGGRVYYEDYSGVFRADQLVRLNQITVVPGVVLHCSSKYLLTTGVGVAFVRTQLKISNYIRILDQSQQVSADLRASNLGLQPHMSLRRNIGASWLMQLSLGYEFQTPSQATVKGNSNSYLINSNGDPVHLQGSGLRLSLGVGYRFKGKQGR